MNFDTLQAAILFGLGGTLFLFERFPASRRMVVPLKYRWLTNIGLALLGSLIIGWVYSLDLLSTAQSFEGGFLGTLEIPPVFEIILVFLLLDLWRYWEHRVFHEVPLLWRVHLVHHSDTSIDITTTHRHHPIEPIITTLMLFILLFAVGFSALSIAVYMVVATIIELIAHANIRLPEPIDAALRLVVVTPAVHAIHHSSEQPQTDSNYGSVITLWDRLFGTYSDPKTNPIPHFGLDYFYKPADTLLGPVLLQPFTYHVGLREGQRNASDHLDPVSATTAISPVWNKTLRFGGAGLLLTLFALWPIVANLAEIWNSSETYMINWLVAPLFIYAMGWHFRDQLLAEDPQPGNAGLGIVLVGLGIWGLAEALNINLGRHIAFVVLLQGIAVCTLGYRLWWKYAPAFLMLFLLIPSGDLLQPLLRHLTTYLVEGAAFISGLPFRSEGFMVWVAEQRYIIVDACSGLSFVAFGLLLAYYFGVLLYRSLLKVLVLAFIGACMGILTNAIRVSTIVWLDHTNGSQMPLSEHGGIAWAALLFGMAALLTLVTKLHPEKPASPQATRTATKPLPAGRIQHLAPAIAGITLLCAANLTMAISTLGPTAHAATSPLDLAMQTYPASDWQLEEINSQKTLTLQLSQGMVVTIREADQNGYLSTQPLELNNDGDWRHQHSQHIKRCIDQNCASYTLATWTKREQHRDHFQHLFYAYYIGNDVTNSVLRYRVLRAWNHITGNQLPHGIIGLWVEGTPPTAEQLIPIYDQFRLGNGDTGAFNKARLQAEPTISTVSR